MIDQETKPFECQQHPFGIFGCQPVNKAGIDRIHGNSDTYCLSMPQFKLAHRFQLVC